MTQIDIIRKAFEMGRNWGETYSGWFIASPEDHEQKIQECIQELASDGVSADVSICDHQKDFDEYEAKREKDDNKRQSP